MKRKVQNQSVAFDGSYSAELSSHPISDFREQNHYICHMSADIMNMCEHGHRGLGQLLEST